MAADVALRRPSATRRPAVLAQPSPLAAFWAAFRENRGAVFGLVDASSLIVAMALAADFIAPHSPIEQFRDAVRAPPVWEAGGSLALPARHRRRRPRHAVAADLRRARLAVHRPVGDERLLRARRRCSASSARWRGSLVDVVDHPRDGPDHGGAEPGAGDSRRRHPRPEPRQHDRRGDDRLSAALCAPGARLGARRTGQGLCHRGARRRRRAAAADVRRPSCPIASRR